MKLQITRTITLPDTVKLARLKRVPELGPKVLFFSGGTALRNTSRELIQYTHNSIHIITPFDSGGSSAILRKAFHMPAIGDVRNRLLALADQSLHGHHEIYQLFAHRFPKDAEKENLEEELHTMIKGKHPQVAQIPDPMRKIIRHHLHLFREFMPHDFDLRKASIGNLILTAGYLGNRRNFDVIIYIFSKLVQVRGVVRPVINKDIHLAAELKSGTIKVGQHILTGKEKKPIGEKITRIWMCRDIVNHEPVNISIRNKIAGLIHGADIICYPMGSFYSSLIANLLPVGVGKAVRETQVPKIYIPNTGGLDPETFGMTIMDEIYTLIYYLSKDGSAASNTPDLETNHKNEWTHVHQLLNYVIIDSINGHYKGSINKKELDHMGIEVIDLPLVTRESHPYIDSRALIPVILSLS